MSETIDDPIADEHGTVVEGGILHPPLDIRYLLLQLEELPPPAIKLLAESSLVIDVPDLSEEGESERGSECDVTNVLVLVADGT